MSELAPVDVLGGAVRAAGLLELEPTEGGIVLHRLPAWARAQHNDIALEMLETMPSGGRFEMVTDATVIELDVQLTLVQIHPEPGPPAAFDLAVDGEVVASEASRTGTQIVPKKVVEAVGDEAFGKNPVGTGAYKLKAWRANESVTLAAHEGYFVPGQPSVATIEIPLIAEESSGVTALKGGQMGPPDYFGMIERGRPLDDGVSA